MNDLIGKETTVELTIASTSPSNGIEWNALIAGYLPQLMRFARRHLPVQLHGRITPDDLVQEVVLRGSNSSLAWSCLTNTRSCRIC